MNRRGFLGRLTAGLSALTLTRVTLAAGEVAPASQKNATGTRFTDSRGSQFRYARAGDQRIDAAYVVEWTNPESRYDGVVPGMNPERVVGMAIAPIEPHAYGWIITRGGASTLMEHR